mmetsp:Transcript_14981/g.26234  ORF Transcript_14981/g.26234 Transcript_14981/m.26234 type:complete len:391 (-) Transcript_14981:3992-5164(-)
MDQVIKLLSERYGSATVKFFKVNAEILDVVAEEQGVTMVPAFAFLLNGAKIGMIEGANPPKIQSELEKHIASMSQQAPSAGESLDERLVKLTNSSHVVLFMKGNANEPKCKFSRAMVDLLNEQGVRFVSFDILQDNDVREGLKTFANWKTYPQLWIGGSLVGGLDSVKELVAKDELKKTLSQGVEKVTPAKKKVDLKALVNRAPIMLFMKGSPGSPACGFSSKIVNILKNGGFQFDSFDILGDDAVRQGLKKFSNWPTYPQLYCNGQLIGGLDIVEELAAEGELEDALACTVVDDAFLEKLVNKAPVMLFMKGSPEDPKCGFSSKIVHILEDHKIAFQSFDILENEQVRQKLKVFSNWPTYPQLYSKGKLVGGLDIVQELVEEGELESSL